MTPVVGRQKQEIDAADTRFGDMPYDTEADVDEHQLGDRLGNLPYDAPEMARPLMAREAGEADRTRPAEECIEALAPIVEAALDHLYVEGKRGRSAQRRAKLQSLTHTAIVARRHARLEHGAGNPVRPQLVVIERRGTAVDQSRSDALARMIGPRRAWTVSMISPLSMPCKYTDVMPRLLCPSWWRRLKCTPRRRVAHMAAGNSDSSWVMWRAGLRIQEALALAEGDLDQALDAMGSACHAVA